MTDHVTAPEGQLPPLGLALETIESEESETDQTEETNVQQALTGEPPVTDPPTHTVESLFPFTIEPVPEGHENPVIEPLRTFGPGGEVIALSYDGGESFVTTPDGIALRELKTAPKRMHYRAKVTAIVDVHTPSTDRRILAPFSAFSRQKVLGGWAPWQTLETIDLGSIDVITLPNLTLPAETLVRLKGIARHLVLDIDEPLPGLVRDFDALAATAALVDLITVPTGKMAQALAAYHPNIRVVPPMFDGERWKGLTKTPRVEGEKLRVAYGNPTANPAIDLAVSQILERYSERIEVVPYEWWTMTTLQERAFYADIDIAIVGDRDPYNSIYPVIVAGAGACAIVAGRTYGQAVKHGHNGMNVGKTDDHKYWRKAISDLINDSRQRIVLARNARNEVRIHTAIQRSAEAILPYKLLSDGKLQGSVVVQEFGSPVALPSFAPAPEIATLQPRQLAFA